MTVEEHHLRVAVGGVARRIGFAEAGFEDRLRTGVPDRTWELLTLFARRGGVVDTPDGIRTKPATLKSRVSKLRGRLRALLGIDGDPLPAARGGAYRARFAARAAAGPFIPVPAGTTWDLIEVVEAEPGVIEIVVPATTATAVQGPGGWEAAGVGSDRRHRFDVGDLSLKGGAARSLLAVLRSGGRAAAGPQDKDLLALGASLSDLVPATGKPFRYDQPGGVWVALFRAGSTVPRAGR